MTIELADKIEERAAREAPATVVYTKPACPQCDMTKRLLDREGIPYTTVDITEDESAYRYVTGTLDYKQAPVVVVDWPEPMGRSSWSGFQPDLIKSITTNTKEN